MSTKSSRQVKGKHLVLSEDIQKLFNSDDESEEALTDEQIKINEKLSESGLLEEGLDWKEKKNLFKSLNASVSTANYEKHVRSSPKPAEATDPKERIIPIDVEDDVLEKGEVAFTRHIDSDPKKNTSNSNNIILRPLEVIKNYFTGSPKKVEKEEHPQGSVKSNNSKNLVGGSTLKCNKKISPDNQKIEDISIDISSDEDNEAIFVSKKRLSPPEAERVDSAKKRKMDQNSTNVNVANLRKPLRTEIEWATKQNDIHFNRRSFQTILNDLQRMNRLRKEASAKYKFPVRWGNPIVRNSSERWDGQTIPQKLIDRYQKFLSKNGSEVREQRSGPPEETFRNFEIEKGTVSSSEDLEKSQAEDLDLFQEKTEPTLENLENVPRQHERKAKARNQIKHSASDEFENVDDDGDEDEEWLPKDVSKRQEKPSKSSKVKNLIDSTHRKPVVKLQKVDNYKFFKSKNPDEVPDENAGNGKGDWSKRDAQESANFEDQNSQDVGGAGDDDQVPCPICNKSFKKELIENHATECASKTFQD